MNDEIRSYGNIANNTLLSLGGAIGSNNPYEGDMPIVRLYKGKALIGFRSISKLRCR